MIRSCALLLMLVVLALSQSCVTKVKLEPSDKPFIVDLNIKIDHEVRHNIEKNNQDLLNLESEAAVPKVKRKAGGKKK